MNVGWEPIFTTVHIFSSYRFTDDGFNRVYKQTVGLDFVEKV